MQAKSTEAFPQPKDHRGLWSWSPADQTLSRPSVTCAAVPAGSSSGAAPGARPHPTSAPGATGPALRLCSLSSSARRRPARLSRLLCRPLLCAVAVAVAGLDLPPPESPLRPESHNTRTVRARLGGSVSSACASARLGLRMRGCEISGRCCADPHSGPRLVEPKQSAYWDKNNVPDIRSCHSFLWLGSGSGPSHPAQNRQNWIDSEIKH